MDSDVTRYATLEARIQQVMIAALQWNTRAADAGVAGAVVALQAKREYHGTAQ